MKSFAVLAVLAVGLTLVTLAPEADAAGTSRTLTISSSSANPQVPFKNFDGSPPKLFDMNGDGRLEIIAQNDNQWVYVFDSKTGAILAQVKTTLPAGWGARSFNGPEVAVFDSGGTVRLILQNSAAYITSYRLDMGASTTTKLVLVKEWERRLDDCFTGPGSDSKPVLADLDRDGRFEIIAATEERGVYALRQDGQLYWKNCMGGGNAEPTVGDLNQDGWPDVVYGSDGGVVSALNGRTGSYMWTYRVLSYFDLQSASMPVGVAIGQLDGIGGPDIVVGARDSHDAVNWTNDHAMLLALDSGGRLLWARQDTDGGNPLTYTHPIIVDADKNGVNEVYWGDWNTIGHKPPYNEADSWKVTGPGNFYRYDNAGNRVWKQSLATYWSNKDLAIADVDGDGVQEVLANGPGTGGDGIWYLNSNTGAKETFVGTAPWKVSRAPVVGDLWGTGTMQWVVEVSAADSSVSGGAILVYDTHVRYSAAWPHLPYPSLTTSTGTTTTTPPPSGGTFGATFTVKSPNTWWQEVTVQPDTPRTITKVEIRFPGYDWQAMTKSSWGAWTSSFNTPAGTPVEFRATDSGNAQSQSAPFTWMDGTLSKRSVSGTSTSTSTSATSSSTTTSSTSTSTSGTPFTATFGPKAIGNDWWLETSVTANHPLAKVEASRNGGAWVLLDKQSWGNWAKSVNVPNGTSVVFRATDTAGATASSPPVIWT